MKSLLFWNKTYAAILSSLLALSLATACGDDDKTEKKEDDTPTTKEDCDKDDTMEWKDNACVAKETKAAESETDSNDDSTETAATTVKYDSATKKFTFTFAKKDTLKENATGFDLTAQVNDGTKDVAGKTATYKVKVDAKGLVTVEGFMANGEEVFKALKAVTDDATAKKYKLKFSADKGDDLTAAVSFELTAASLQYLVTTVDSSNTKKFGDADKGAAFLKEFDKLIGKLVKKTTAS